MAAMGFLVTADRANGARNPRTAHSNSSDSLRDDKLGSIGSNPADVDHRYCNASTQEVEARQLAISVLAQLVRAIEPAGADALARFLINEFGSLGQVLGATVSKITQCTGNLRLAQALSAARVAVIEGLREEICRSRVNLRDPSFLAYLAARTRGSEENLHAVFLDSHGRYLTDERVVNGDWTTIPVKLRPLLRRAVEVGAAKIVLCHNHPSGDPQPSTEDISFTQEASKISSSLGIELLDHLIVAGKAVFSMRTAGLVK